MSPGMHGYRFNLTPFNITANSMEMRKHVQSGVFQSTIWVSEQLNDALSLLILINNTTVKSYTVKFIKKEIGRV